MKEHISWEKWPLYGSGQYFIYDKNTKKQKGVSNVEVNLNCSNRGHRVIIWFGSAYTKLYSKEHKKHQFLFMPVKYPKNPE